MAVVMWAIFKEIKTPGATGESYVVSEITSDTPDSPDEVPGTRNWINALVERGCARRNEEVRRAKQKEWKEAQLAERARLRRKAKAYNFAPHMFEDDELPEGVGSHICQKQDVTQLYRGCLPCHYDAQRRLSELPEIA